jgi:hypothetical protein
MAMTYTELKTNVQDITEMSFTDAQLSMFTKQVEQRVYGIIKDLPILRKTLAGQSVSATAEYVLPADCLYVHSVVQHTNTNRKAIMQKARDFLFEAYPLTSETVVDGNVEIKYYALDSDATANQEASRMTLILAPKWDASVTLDVEYQYHPRSIVDTDGDEEQPWLGTNYDTALLNGVLVEAAKFMKAEPDMVQMYEQQFVLALQQMQNTVDIRLKSDSFRPKGQPPKPIPIPTQPPQRQE